MILLTTITLSISLKSLLILFIIFTFHLIIIGISISKFQKFEKETRYKNYGFNFEYKKLYNIMWFMGVLIVPLFKRIIKDARYYIVMKQNITEWRYYIDSNLILNEIPNNKNIVYERHIKILKLKYSKENFVNRIVFSIFVSK
jgi:hypothetical protein